MLRHGKKGVLAVTSCKIKEKNLVDSDSSDDDVEMSLTALPDEPEVTANIANESERISPLPEVQTATIESKKSKKRSRKQRNEDQEEKNLEKFLFADETDLLKNLDEKLVTENILSSEKPKKKPVWEDEDDVNIKTENILAKKKARHQNMYAKHLEERFVNTYGDAKWAQLDQDEKGYDSDEEMLRTSTNLLNQYSPLAPDNIILNKCMHLNYHDVSQKAICSVEFHPMSQVALVANSTGKTTLFQVDGQTNSKIQSVQFDQYPISCAHFSTNGEEVIVGSRKYQHFFYYHMIQGKIIKVPWDKGLDSYTTRRIFVSPDGKFLVICGRYGHIHLLSAKTKEWIGQLKMNDNVVTIAFSPNGQFMYSHGSTGQVYIWDMTRRICVGQFYDEGCITGTSLAVSPNDQFLATGSDSGIVNVYEISSLDNNKNPKPVKTFMNMTTEVSSLKFNHSSEILVMASDQKENSVKLAHFPSMNVFPNFPIQRHKLDKVTSLDISLNSGFMSLANKQGKVLLYRIKNFGNY